MPSFPTVIPQATPLYGVYSRDLPDLGLDGAGRRHEVIQVIGWVPSDVVIGSKEAGVTRFMEPVFVVLAEFDGEGAHGGGMAQTVYEPNKDEYPVYCPTIEEARRIVAAWSKEAEATP